MRASPPLVPRWCSKLVIKGPCSQLLKQPCIYTALKRLPALHEDLLQRCRVDGEGVHREHAQVRAAWDQGGEVDVAAGEGECLQRWEAAGGGVAQAEVPRA